MLMAMSDHKLNYHQIIIWYVTKMSQSVQVHHLPISNRNVVKGLKHLIHHSYLNIQENVYIKYHLQHDFPCALPIVNQELTGGFDRPPEGR